MNTRSAKTGAKLTEVLRKAWTDGIATKGDFARYNADFVAMAASEGYITTRQAAGLFGRSWQITPEGLKHYWIMEGMTE